MTVNAMDLFAIAAMIAIGLVGSHAILSWKLRATASDRLTKMEEHIDALDDAIRALETRLPKYQPQAALSEQPRTVLTVERPTTFESVVLSADDSEESGEIAPEIQAAIAAATVATLGPNAVVHSVKALPSAWTQQGRVLVQGGHNLRVQR